MLSYLRFLALVTFGLLTVVFGVMALISSFMYTRYGSRTRKTVLVSGMYLALTFISCMLAVIILDPTKTSAILLFLPIGLSFVAIFVGVDYFFLSLVEKGPRKMFAPVWQFLKCLFTPRNSG